MVYSGHRFRPEIKISFIRFSLVELSVLFYSYSFYSLLSIYVSSIQKEKKKDTTRFVYQKYYLPKRNTTRWERGSNPICLPQLELSPAFIHIRVSLHPPAFPSSYSVIYIQRNSYEYLRENAYYTP